MAWLNNPKCTATTILIRSLRFSTSRMRNIQFSTSPIITKENFEPVKYTTTKAAKVPISEAIGLNTSYTSRLWYEKYVVLASIASFIAYFFFLRQENDIDEMLKGFTNSNDPKAELLRLKIHLKYCETNKLPTAKIKARIRELEEEEKYVSPFRM